jgi:uncharacterized protein YndB with AHSA1/START domain
MMQAGIAAFLLAAALPLAPAGAGVVARSADGFTILHQAWVARPPQAQWDALVDWGGWWPDSHTVSGSAANIDLDLEANGELEEEWEGGEVLHGTVVQARPGRLLRLSAPLGPLQALPGAAVLDIALAPERDGTRVTLTYRVGGPASAGLGQLADPVDRVFAEAFARLLVHVPPPADPEPKGD